ncbi:MAG: hypothetical protein NVSMB20_03150 [Bradyrhizobium sp.]
MSRIITVSGADKTLFHVAQREMGDAKQAVRIMQASGLTDMWLSGIVTLTIPGPGVQNTDGLPAPGTKL